MTNSSNLIDSLEVYVLNNPDDVKPHWVSHFIVPTANELLIKKKNYNLKTLQSQLTQVRRLQYQKS